MEIILSFGKILQEQLDQMLKELTLGKPDSFTKEMIDNFFTQEDHLMLKDCIFIHL